MPYGSRASLELPRTGIFSEPIHMRLLIFFVYAGSAYPILPPQCSTLTPRVVSCALCLGAQQTTVCILFAGFYPASLLL